LEDFQKKINACLFLKNQVPSSGFRTFDRKLADLKIKSERDSVHSQNSFQNSEDFNLHYGLDKDILMQTNASTIRTRSKRNINHPQGISLMTTHLLDYYRKCFPSMKYDQSMKPHRILTEIPEN
jgi:hypothetical protein